MFLKAKLLVLIFQKQVLDQGGYHSHKENMNRSPCRSVKRGSAEVDKPVCLFFTPTHTFPGHRSSSASALSDLCCWSPTRHLLLFHPLIPWLCSFTWFLPQILAEEFVQLNLFTPSGFASHILSSIFISLFLEP